MASVQSTNGQGIAQTLKKVAVSAFVVGTFVVYAIHDRSANPEGAIALAPTLPPDDNQANALAQPVAQSATPAPSPSPFSTVAFSTSTAIPTDEALANAVNSATSTDLPTATDVPPTATNIPATATNVPPTATNVPQSGYKDGTFTGPDVDAYYGNVQAQVIIQGGKITQVKFLDYPHDRRTSQRINNNAMPRLIQEVISAQSINVNIVSGATLTSQAFGQSMQSALSQAHY